jgi:hypothetical protein
MRILLVLVMFFSFDNSATSIRAENVVLSHENAIEYGLVVKNEYDDASKVCTTITINKFHKKVEQYGLFIVIKSSQGQHVFSSKIIAYPNKNTELVNYSYCYQSYDVVLNVIAYGYPNGLVTANLEFSSELIAP